MAVPFKAGAAPRMLPFGAPSHALPSLHAKKKRFCPQTEQSAVFFAQALCIIKIRDRALADTACRFLYFPQDTSMYTATAIEDIVRATLDESACERQRHLLRQSLLNLVRLAQAELRAELQASVGKAVQPMEVALPA